MKRRKKNKCGYEISYFDPADPKGERWKTWRFKTRKAAKAQQADLKVAWQDTNAREFPIRRVCQRKLKRKIKRG